MPAVRQPSSSHTQTMTESATSSPTPPNTGLAISGPYQRLLVGALMFLTYAVFAMAWAAGGSLLKVIMVDMRLSLSQASFLTTIVGFAKILGPAIAGFVVARTDLRWAFMTASAFICVGIFAPISLGYPLLLFARFCMGIGGAMVLVYFSSIAMQWFPEKERVIVNGLNAVSASAGIMFALFVTPLLMDSFAGSWRKTLLLYSTVSIVLALLWLMFGRNESHTGAISLKTPNSTITGYRNAAKDVNTWKLSFAGAGATTVALSLFTYFPTYYSSVLGFQKTTVVFFAPAIAMSAGIPGTLLGVYVSKKIGRRIPLIRFPGVFFMLAAIGMIVFKDPGMIILSAVVFGFSLYFAWPALLTVPQELTGQTSEKIGYMMGIYWSTTYAFATLGVWLIGKIIDISGDFRYGLVLAMTASASLFVSSFILPETGRLGSPDRIPPFRRVP
jgi:CP family cyanate transporter-like MFS transporter